jgi:glucose-1-phosphatase
MTEHDADGRIRLVCFDLGGVLVRICRSVEEACQRAGVAVRPLPSDEAFLIEFRRLILRHEIGEVNVAEFARQQSRLLGGLYSPQELLAIHEAWLLGEYDGTAELIDRLHDDGVETAALSNTNGGHWRQMADYAALRRVRIPLASHLLKLAKPDAAIFREAERRFGVTGTSIVYFDDKDENVHAARDAGWQAYRVDPDGCTASQMIERLRACGVVE